MLHLLDVVAIVLIWTLLYGVLLFIGLATIILIAGKHVVQPSLGFVPWIGLAVLLLLLQITNLFLPLNSIGVAIAVLGLSAGSVILTAFRFSLIRQTSRAAPDRLGIRSVSAAILVSIVAFASTGLPSNYDSGLYHIGMIRHMAESAVPLGLANLNFAFGFQSSIFELSAFSTSFPGGQDNYRLMNGFLVATLIVTSLALPLRDSSFAKQWSQRLLFIGMILVLAYVVQFPQGLLSSPTPDTASMVFVLIFFACAVRQLGRSDASDLFDVVCTAAMATLAVGVRPQNWLLVIPLAIVLALSRRTVGRKLLFLFIPLAAQGLLTCAKSVLTTGWIMYPVPALGLPVAWRFPDPAAVAMDISSMGKSTLLALFWMTPDDRSISILLRNGPFVALLIMSLGLIVLACTESFSRSPCLLVSAPALVSLVCAGLLAPDPRFVWGTAVGLFAANASLLWPANAVGALEIIAAALVISSILITSMRGVPQEIAHEARGASFDDKSRRFLTLPALALPSLGTRNASNHKLSWPTMGEQCWDAQLPCARRQPTHDLLYGQILGRSMWYRDPAGASSG